MLSSSDRQETTVLFQAVCLELLSVLLCLDAQNETSKEHCSRCGCGVRSAGCGVWGVVQVIRCVNVHHSCNIWSWNVEGFRSWLLLWYFIMEFDPFANLAMGQICQPCNPSFDAEGASRSQSAAGTALSVCARLITQLI